MREIATIKDIAQKTNVSPSTVSRALNGNSRISKETVTKIKKMASEMEYYPNYAAQNLTRGDANIVGIVFPVTSRDAPANPFHIDLMRGASSALTPMHYEMLVAISATEKELLSSVKSMVNQAKVHNFLIFYAVKNDPITAYLRKKKLNFVIIGDPSDNSGDRYVDNNNVAAGEAAAKCLIDNYHVLHPLFIQSSKKWPYETSRLKGYQQYLKQNGYDGNVWVDNSSQTIDDFLKNHAKIDGIVCADDILFAKLNSSLQKFKLPTVCFNSSRLMGMILGDSEKIDMQPRELGQEAVKLLFNQNAHQKIVNFKFSDNSMQEN